MAKRRAKRIVDRKVKGEISEEEKPILTLIANIIAQIAVIEMAHVEEIERSYDTSSRSSSSPIKNNSYLNKLLIVNVFIKLGTTNITDFGSSGILGGKKIISFFCDCKSNDNFHFERSGRNPYQFIITRRHSGLF